MVRVQALPLPCMQTLNTASLLHTGARASALDRTGTTFVAERDFLIWLLHRNVTVCDLGAGTSELLYKGVPTPRPSLPCPAPMPAPARVPEQRTPLDRPPRTDDATWWSAPVACVRTAVVPS